MNPEYKQHFKIPGKLMLTGEYAVLDGSLSLALPTTYGQHFEFTESDKDIFWESFDRFGDLWFSAQFNHDTLRVLNTTDEKIARTLKQLLNHCRHANRDLPASFNVKSKLEFERSWGLGSSSTLVAALSQWAEIDFYPLLQSAFSGSGYDVAIGLTGQPLIYYLKDGVPHFKEVQYNPPFSREIFFVHLGKKQNSEEQIKSVKQPFSEVDIREINAITDIVINASTTHEFIDAMRRHEQIISRHLGRATIQDSMFSDFPGFIKSLGAWGGDFVLAIGHEQLVDYFSFKGYPIVIGYHEMILSDQS